ncbi:solute carrier organic anion transporter family member 2A1-like [Mya arenaria]|uniref:solute carrier organic anion transporter family member 2A1-like n=1 Tax=Mya arenaria TaxID=6604 RepID=UPI0022E3C3A9|nr:solute carrier organic anion transporter family member 2A1-like [Mya arenaria]XP_052765231.1 solute carrier organic anion transporter family member 2A1-like [Mya arenaria]XP_052765232.1 solute carrier organic anion transporter family member 2A1-like [Mya arenaria]XP_052765233.1 solute carrier organic anion transporter family member 2A1-like [Mya arenaria]
MNSNKKDYQKDAMHTEEYEAGFEIPEDIENDTKCGLGSFKPESLQVFARIGAFVGLYSFSGLLTQTLTTYVNSQVSMLEKQFGFSSAETGFLMSCNDIGFLLCVVFAGYIARKVHIPRGLGTSTILFGVCGLMCALPYFISDRSTYALSDRQPMQDSNMSVKSVVSSSSMVPLCLNSSGDSNYDARCDSQSSTAERTAGLQELYIKKVAFTLIAVGMFLQGVGKSCRYPFVSIYIDDAVEKRKTGFYMGILVGTGIFGPALAYLLGGLFSKIYVTLESVDITPRDPRWIGAWWLGFLVFGGFSLLFSVPIMCFPRYLKSHKRRGDLHVIAKEKALQKLENNSTRETVVKEVKEFLAAVLRLLKNPTYVILSLSSVVNLVGVAGVLSFMPKYLASQYSVPLWQANIILALSSISAVSLGSFLGGIITRRIPMTPLTTIKMLLIFYAVNIVCSASGFFLGCKQPVVFGDNAQISSLVPPPYKLVPSPCMSGCECNDQKYFPICGQDGRSYFSPCHAGCSVKDKGSFTNCTCIEGGQAESGLCDQGCSTNLYVYAAFTFVGKLFTAFKIIPTFIAKLRCVEERDRAVSSAFAGFLTAALGWMPGPVIFGAIIDGTCKLWKYTCGERQSCLLYDIVFFRNAVHGYGLVASALAMIILSSLIFYFRYKGHDDWGDGMRREIEKREVKLDVQGKKNGNENENIFAQGKDVEKDTLVEGGN